MPTFDALVEACARLLPELGYERLTTQAIAERAGVGIGSLYEYFPGKDAIIGVVVERLVERVMSRLTTDLHAILAHPSDDGVERWIERLFEIVEAERALVATLLDQVPYIRQLEPLRDLPQTLLQFSEQARVSAGVELRQPSVALTLINNLVATTILQVVLAPPSGTNRTELIATLSAHVTRLILGSQP
jgi:AcrR family transcriptional regulator